ncbi:MAG: amino acid ABC transporter permease [Streptococcaceae bacterium]|jgi:cystine transport system permease protein|nr:amino acid ABC transporter permease [Streptococcaceae bacterium]
MDKTIETIMSSILPILVAGLKVTIPLTIISFIFGLIIAIVTAIAKISSIRLLNLLFSGYVWIFRGTPLLVQLFIVFYGLPKAGIELNAWSAAITTFSLNTGAYASESVRASILSIPKGQWEAAQSIGMSYWMSLRRIIAPQAFRICLPPLSNTFISLVKDTSLASSITMVEMFMVSQRIAARTFDPLLLYSLVAVIYLLLCTVLTYLQGKLEKTSSSYV